MTPEIIESISKMTATGNRLELPSEQLTNYPAVKKALVKAGGKYRKNGFDFTTDASEIKARLTGGEVIDDKKKFQFFETPAALVEQMLAHAGISEFDSVLEPSAGHGAILDELVKLSPMVDAVEINSAAAKVLNGKHHTFIQGDFLTLGKDDLDCAPYDVIVANPPFTKNQDIDHVEHMYHLLSEDGRLVAIMSKSWTFGEQKKQVAFREWISEVNALVIDLPSGTFAESGTQVSAVMVVIDKE